MNTIFDCKIVNIFLPICFNIYVLGAQKNCLIETGLLSWLRNKKVNLFTLII